MKYTGTYNILVVMGLEVQLEKLFLRNMPAKIYYAIGSTKCPGIYSEVA